eukprot:Phypoly_transcript_07101.p1 GENE.Phypoly_transcript_07101~~Phypoly_transcript_07101.p1  ORF type:complete len:538 (+),score=68.30 Phypoly_transcript_07101:61-1674(+)
MYVVNRSLVGASKRIFASNLNRVPQRFTTSEAASSGENAHSHKKRKWPRRLAYVGAAGLILFFGDLYANDDLDEISNYWRTPLPKEEQKKRPKVVILGGGWAALSMLRKLHTDKFDVTVVSPKNYFLFTPLLPGSTTGRVELRSIMSPIREYCDSTPAGAGFIEAECVGIDAAAKTVKCQDVSAIKGTVTELNLPYDHLVVAVGAEPATFGVPGVRENAVFMKEINDSRTIRDRIMDCFETASFPGQPQAEIDRLLHFVVVGGGPSGVEYVSELNDFLLDDLNKHFPQLTKHVKITLIEALPHILNVFDAKLINYVEQKFKSSSNIEVLTNTAVTKVDEKDLLIKAKDGIVTNVPYGTLVWVTGNAPRKVVSDLITQLGPEQPSRRGLTVDEFFRVKGAEGIWAMGDCTFTKVPATAQVASQEGRYLGRLFNAIADEIYNEKLRKEGDASIQPVSLEKVLATQTKFEYHHYGSFAYVGEHTAVAEYRKSPSSTSTGLMTFILWRSVYMTKLLSVKNRMLVLFDWIKTGIFGRDISRG